MEVRLSSIYVIENLMDSEHVALQLYIACEVTFCAPMKFLRHCSMTWYMYMHGCTEWDDMCGLFAIIMLRTMAEVFTDLPAREDPG